MFIYGRLNSNSLFLASNDETSNFEPNRAFTRFTKLLIKQTQTSFYRKSNKLEHVHILVIEHPICGFEQPNIKLQTYFDPSLISIACRNPTQNNTWWSRLLTLLLQQQTYCLALWSMVQTLFCTFLSFFLSSGWTNLFRKHSSHPYNLTQIEFQTQFACANTQ